ncbi:telomere-protecting terminal protein Tpg [Streptomyces erythrochromogenes]|uniref:telomere-protecting terminal protein Tpg n=1 Tax=Streptomyces erythrochromogenes TaxID=285574 RepID=UPI00224EF807|nr:helix-turn-helix domain-containing protein [Streptomyces erythrochromogenes]MCX5589543.1 helix-turn-helix domain-containing protein [Streptomyces erythrochromogenes]
MTDDQRAQQVTRTHAKIMDALSRAERALFTRPAPKSPNAQMRYLRKRERGSTKSLAERLGVSRKTVQRYLSGASTKPNKRLQEALVQETESEWQPQVRAQARQRATTSGGFVIRFCSTLGFTANGSSDDTRVRDLSIAVSPSHAALIIAARDKGATEADLYALVEEAIADGYFRLGGGGRASLKVRFGDIQWLNIDF